MNKRMLVLACIMLGGISIGFTQQPDWENEQVFGINKQPTHVTYVPYATIQQALQDVAIASPWYSSLNGDWKFNWVNQPAERPADFLYHSTL